MQPAKSGGICSRRSDAAKANGTKANGAKANGKQPEAKPVDGKALAPKPGAKPVRPKKGGRPAGQTIELTRPRPAPPPPGRDRVRHDVPRIGVCLRAPGRATSGPQVRRATYGDDTVTDTSIPRTEEPTDEEAVEVASESTDAGGF